jgi:thioredoxin-related protein
MTRGKGRAFLVAMTLLLICQIAWAAGDIMEQYQIGGHGQGNIKYPAWFKESFLDLRDDLGDAKQSGKRGVIVFLSQKNCSHCQAFIDTTLSDPVIQERVQKNYDIIALDIFNDLELTDIDGSVSTIKNFAEKQRARFTPTLLFYGVEGARLFKIIGFYPPAKFNRVLDYVEGGDYQRETLGQYLQKDRTVTGQQDIQYDFTLFSRPPYLLDRARFKGQQPILVFFETPDCNPCQRFHEGALNNKNVRRLMPEFEAVQLNSLDNISKVKVPSGRVLTPQQWSNELQLAYDYSVIFFDENGVEVHRLDAETGKDRMSGSMQYVLEKSYLQHEQFLQWRKENVMKKR